MNKDSLSKKDSETLALLKALSGSLRFHILLLLNTHPDGLTVGDIAEILNGSISRVSHQLNILKTANLVTATGLDHQVLYTLNSQRIQTLLNSFCGEHQKIS